MGCGCGKPKSKADQQAEADRQEARKIIKGTSRTPEAVENYQTVTDQAKEDAKTNA